MFFNAHNVQSGRQLTIIEHVYPPLIVIRLRRAFFGE